MKAVVQRVTLGRVFVNGETVGEIGRGLVVLLGIGEGDGDEQARWMAHKLANLRVFADDCGKMNRSVLDSGGQVLLISQFTLYGDAHKGHRPGFSGAAAPEVAAPLIESVASYLRQEGVPVATGRFQVHMQVEIHNDGPVTILLDR
jgi:D-tyrosyl-tRNA(Tyr) deacylase